MIWADGKIYNVNEDYTGDSPRYNVLYTICTSAKEVLDIKEEILMIKAEVNGKIEDISDLTSHSGPYFVYVKKNRIANPYKELVNYRILLDHRKKYDIKIDDTVFTGELVRADVRQTPGYYKDDPYGLTTSYQFNIPYSHDLWITITIGPLNRKKVMYREAL